jgi:predicted DNA-binding transcriptional regulator AlpA
MTSIPNQLLARAEPRGLQELREVLSEREVSNWLGVSQPTLSRLRRDKNGPAFIRLSARRIGYRRTAVEAYLKQQEQQTKVAVVS